MLELQLIRKAADCVEVIVLPDDRVMTDEEWGQYCRHIGLMLGQPCWKHEVQNA